MIPADQEWPGTPDPDSAAIMADIDGMSRPMRALVHEFGYVIVRDMIAEGYRNARVLQPMLEVWRERRQDAWLATDYVSRRSAESIIRAAEYRAACGHA